MMINQFIQKNIQVYKCIYNLFGKPLRVRMMLIKVNLLLNILDTNFIHQDHKLIIGNESG